MSELKAFDIVVSEEGYGEGIVKYRRAVYDKSEVDKVIEELKEKYKTEVKELLCLIRDKENNFNRAFDSVEKELRHYKYKRCLAMAQWCMDAECETEKDADFLVRWEYRWLALAEEPTWAKFLQLIHKEVK